MSTTYTIETLQQMDENDLGYVYETVTNQTVPSRPKRKQLIEEILATQTISSPTRGRKTSKSSAPKSASRSASRSPVSPRSKSPRPEKTKTKSEISLSPPVTTVRSTMIKAPKKVVAPIKQNVVVGPDVTARLIIEKDIQKDKEKGTPTTPSEIPAKRGRGRPPKSKKSEESPRTSSDEYGPPKSPTSDKKSLVENMKSQMKDIKVLNPKGSFQSATIREKQPGIITPIVVSDVNVSTVALPVTEEAKISIADFLSRIGGGTIEKQPSPRPSPVKTTIQEEEIKVGPPPSIPGRKTYKPKPGEFIKESKLEEGTVLLRPSDEEGEAVKIVSKKIAKIVPPSEEVVSDEEGEKGEELLVSKTIKLIPKVPSPREKIEEVQEEKKEEKKPRRRATVVKRTSETLEIPSEQQVEQSQIELPASPKRVSSRAASPIKARSRSPSRSPSRTRVESPLPSPEPSPKPKKKIVSIPDISDIPSEKKSGKKKVSPKTLQKIEEEIDFEKVPLTKKKKSKAEKIPTPVTSSAESIDSEELLDIPLKTLSKKQITKIIKKGEKETAASAPAASAPAASAPAVSAPVTTKKTKKPVPSPVASPISSPVASPVASPSPSPVLVRRTTKTTVVKETPKGPKEVIKNIEKEEEEIEEPVSASQAEEIFTRITSGASSKASSKAPSRVPSRVPSERKTVDAYAVFEKLNVRRNKVNVGRTKNDYTGKQLEEILIELGIAHTGKKEVLVKRVLDKMNEVKYDM